MAHAGDTVAHYRLTRRLGSGGMGEVFLAEDATLDRLVAIKFLMAPDDVRARQRLLREARAVAALEHPSVCAVYEVGNDPSAGDFIVMQFIDGEPLAGRLRRGRMSLDDTLRLTGQIAEALRAAHRRGIVHRDLKPQNIMMTTAGVAKLLDFGLARHLASGEIAAEADTASRLTWSHAMLGTPGYMSPEQLRGQPADARSDIFALGCVVYECLTGRRAFAGSTAAEIHAQALHVEPPAPSTVNPDVIPGLDAFCSRLMQKSAADRFQSAEEVIGAVHALAGVSRSSEATATVRPRRLLSAVPVKIFAAAAIGILIAAGAWFWIRSSALPTPPADVRRWYTLGVEFMRDGAYASAASSFQEAVSRFPGYVQAYSRLADAESELDDERSAQAALVNAAALAPNRWWLPADERLRLDAVQASVLRKRAEAVDAYRQLAERHPTDAGAWLDLGRAYEAGQRRVEAVAQYQKALSLDPQYAAAHLRLGMVQSSSGKSHEAAASLDEAIRLYHAASNVEGEAEALLAKGRAANTANQLGPARAALEQVVRLAADPLFISQRLRAQFELARVTLLEGHADSARTMAQQAADEAANASLETLAADGLIEIAIVLSDQHQDDQAEAQLNRSLQLAAKRDAVKTTNRAKLQMASVRYQSEDFKGALSLANQTVPFFETAHYANWEATAKNIASRAQEAMENYGEAYRLSTETLQLGDAVKDDSIVTTALENLTGQLITLGRLPEALAYRERAERLYKGQQSAALLAYDLPLHADLLIRLGRTSEAADIVSDLDAKIASGAAGFANLGRRVTLLRMLMASTTLESGRVLDLAKSVAPAQPKPSTNDVYTSVLVELARARLGQPGAPVAAIAARPRSVSSPSIRRELSYWAAETLRIRGAHREASDLASEALADLAGHENPELGWRLGAVVRLCGIAPPPANGAKMPRLEADRDITLITTSWREDASRYFARPDLAALRRLLNGSR